MPSIRTLVRSASFALALAVSTASLSAFAHHGAGDDAGEADETHGRKAQSFPMKADKFRSIVAKRIGHARATLERMLDSHGVPGLLQGQIRKDFEAGAAKVGSLAEKAAADGKVTKEEAREVREFANAIKRELRGKYLPGAADDDEPGKGKGKGKANGKSQGKAGGKPARADI